MGVMGSLRVRLLLLSLVTIIPATGLTLYTSLEERRLAILETQQDALRVAGLAANQQRRMIEGTRQFLITLALLPESQGRDGRDCSALFADLLAQYDQYSNIGVINRDGDLVCSAVPSSAPVNVSDRPHFQRAVATRDFAGGEFLVGRVTGKAAAGFGYPVLGGNGDVDAVVFVLLDVGWLAEIPAVAQLPEGATLTVVDQSGTILARHPDPADWVGRTAPEAPMIKAVLAARGEELLETVGLDGMTRLYAFRPLSEDPRASAYVSVGIPTAAAVAGRDQILARSLAGLGILVALALAAAWTFGHVIILRPVSALVHAANRLGAGDFGARSGLPHGRGEISQLARAFDAMGAALEARKGEAERADRLLKERDEQLRQAQKLESIGQLAGGIAHDFNNLLTAIVGVGEMVQDTLDRGDPRRAQLDQVLQASERGAALVRQLLAFSRLQPLEPVALDLNAVVADVEKLLGAVLGKHIVIKTVLQPGLGLIEADPTQIDQILLNLAVNARDAMPDGGELTIETRAVDLDAAYAAEHVDVQAGRYVMLAVSDNGEGMDAETRVHIFEPFFTTKEVGKGTGLGLSTVYGIVKQSGGDIWVYSEPGGGTSFKIYLPLADVPATVSEVSKGTGPLPGGAEAILLVEDDALVRSFAASLLGALGYRVVRAVNGTDALQILERHEFPIDLVLTDLVMPGMTGGELGRELRRRYPDKRILYMSGFSRDFAAVQSEAASGAFLEKPFSPRTLAQKVREVLDSPVEADPLATTANDFQIHVPTR